MDPLAEALASELPAFARAVRAIVTSDPAALRLELDATPSLIHARSGRAHRCTLLHYLAANGVEDALQRPIPASCELADILLAAGAEPDATCDAYAGRCPTTLALLVSSDHPARAGVAGALVDRLCAAGAAVDGLGGDQMPLAYALLFGHVACVDALLARGARTGNVVFAAAAGDVAYVARWLDGDPAVREQRCPTFPFEDTRAAIAEQAMVFASLCGRTDVVRLLLDHGTNIDATPTGSHWTATALHAAAGQGQRDVVELLVERGADASIKDVRYQSTPLGWAEHMGRDDVIALLSDFSL